MIEKPKSKTPPTEPPQEPDHENDCAVTKTEPPELWRERFDVCCECDEGCDCSSSSSEGSNCIQDAIDLQDKLINEAESAKKAKEELTQLLGKASQAAKTYTVAKHQDFVKRWNEQDEKIADLLGKLKCSVPNWECVIKCHVCPILNELYLAEQDLYGDPVDYCEHLVPCESSEPPANEPKADKWCAWYKHFRNSRPYLVASTIAINHHALRNWLDRDYRQKSKTFQQVKAVVSVWETPVELIEAALTDNAKLIEECFKGMAERGTHVVYDVFMRLLPRHLAIGPRKAEAKGEEPESVIPKEFLDFLSSVCPCDKGDSVCCCFTNVGELSFRDRLIGPQPYIVPPNKYFEIVCCLAKHRYLPTQEAAASAKAALEAKDDEIERIEKFIADGMKDFEQNAKAAIPSQVEPCDKKPNGSTTTTATTQAAAKNESAAAAAAAQLATETSEVGAESMAQAPEPMPGPTKGVEGIQVDAASWAGAEEMFDASIADDDVPEWPEPDSDESKSE